MSAQLSRRRLLRGAGAAGVGLAASWALSSCARGSGAAMPAAGSAHDYILAHDPEVQQAEDLRAASGGSAYHRLSAESGLVALEPGRHAETWGYRDLGSGAAAAALAALGPTIRATRGDRLRVDVDNALPDDTSVHWHGLRIRNDMDGAPPDTQDPIAPGASFSYDFLLPDHGTYWYHSHSGMQADRGLFGAVVVEDPDDRSGADEDVVLVLDDWLDGIAATPDEVLAALGPVGPVGHGHGGSPAAAPPEGISAGAYELVAQGVGESRVLGGPSQHIAYPLHLINGRTPGDPARVVAAPGARLRLRVVNAAAETPYRVALAGHRLTVIAADGFDTEPFETDAVLVAPAQRVDVLVDLASGAWPFVARVEGRDGAALAVIASDDAVGATPAGLAAAAIPELDGRLATDAELRPAEAAVLDERDPDRLWSLELIEASEGYVWGIAGEDVADMRPTIGDRVRIELRNTTAMWHPMHLHGHTFASRGHRGLRRDTIAVLPGETAVLDFDADNPGRWMIHCHNAYHFAAGMTAPIRYVR